MELLKKKRSAIRSSFNSSHKHLSESLAALDFGYGRKEIEFSGEVRTVKRESEPIVLFK